MTPLTEQLVGARVGDRDEANGYWFWGMLALFVGVPEFLAAFSRSLRREIPWPTISNLVGRDLEAHHHWVAPVVVGAIVVVTVRALTYPVERKKAGRGLQAPAAEAVHLRWSRLYILVVAAAGAAAGLIAKTSGADKNEVGYAIYATLGVLGVAVPSALAYWWNRVFALPTLFATLAFVRARSAWVAAFVAALLVVLIFHLALYPWPNYPFGVP